EATRQIDLRRDDIVISTQVLLELHTVCRRKLGMGIDETNKVIRAVAEFPVLDADRSLVLEGVRLAKESDISIFDAMIVAAAQRAGCTLLLTEDLNDGQDFGGLVITNPFAEVGA